MMSRRLNYSAHIQKQDYNYVFVFNVDVEMLHNVQQEIAASAVTQKAPKW